MKLRPGLVVGAIALAAAAFYAAHEVGTRREQKRQEEIDSRIFDTLSEEVESITVEHPGLSASQRAPEARGTIVRLQRSGGGWTLTSPESAPADRQAVADVLRMIGACLVTKTVEREASSPERYGLGDIATRLSVRTTGGNETSIEVGLDAPVGAGIYIRRTGSNDVLLSGIELRDVRSLIPGVLMERTLLPGASEATGIEIVSAGPRVLLEKGTLGWELKDPFAFPADSSRVEAMLSALSVQKLQATDQQPPSAAEAGIDPARIELTCRMTGSFGDRARSIAIGDIVTGTLAWARRGGDARFYMVDTKSLPFQDRSPEDWCDTRAGSVDRYAARAFSLRIGERSLSLARDASGWKDSSGTT
ncbi:MAG: DUF4340 domain-containing protein, partial [Vicinamibacteria bacterium]